MKDRDLLAALVYNELREKPERAATPRSPAAAGVVAFLGLLVTVVALALFLAVVFTLSSIF